MPDPHEFVVRRAGALLRQPDGTVWHEPETLDAQSAQYLSQLGGFGTIAEQAALISRQMGLGGDAGQAIEDHLRELGRLGHLISESDLWTVGEAAPALRIDTCAVLTCDRPAGLRRTLQDLMRPAQRDGRKLLVSDDGSEPESGTSERPSTGLIVHWLNRSHRQGWVERIPNRELRRIASFAMLPDKASGENTVGSSINAVLLHAQGGGIALFDDDICRPVGRSIQSEPSRWAVSGAGDPTHLMLYDSEDQAITDLEWVDRDPASLLETCLGQPVREIGAARRMAVDRGVTSANARAITDGGRVLSSMMGFAGDSGMSTPQWHLGLQNDPGRRLEGNFSRRLLSRNVIRAAECHKLSQAAFFMNACVGLDQRAPLPPFFPSGRNSDNLFGHMLQRTEPTSFRHYLPFAVGHRPLQMRVFHYEHLYAARAGVHAIETIRQSLEDWREPPALSSAEDRTRALGEFIEGLARMPLGAFTDWLRSSRVSAISANLRWLGFLLDSTQEVRHRAIRDCQEHASAELQQVSRDAGSVYPANTEPRQYQRQLRHFGELLQAWGELREHARAVPLHGEERSV